MYYSIVNDVLDVAISAYLPAFQGTAQDLDKGIATHISSTSSEHYNPSPNIDYSDPLCRLAYLFVHAGANAYLFEQAVRASISVRNLLTMKSGNTVSACALGGGPGTELLGLAHYLRDPGPGPKALPPRRLNFTVLDRVMEWGETWAQIAKASEQIVPSTTVSPMFYPLDLMSSATFDSYAWLFGQQDIFTLNYLLSENQTRLPDFQKTLSSIVSRASTDARFVVIDRLEQNTNFRDRTRSVLLDAGLQIIDDFHISDCVPELDTALNLYIKRFDRRRPRRWFRTIHRQLPTVFALTAMRAAQ